MISDKQLKILAFPHTDYECLICDGAIRSGKTIWMIVSFVMWAMSCFNGVKFGICGKTVKSAIENIIKPLMALTYWAQHGYSTKFSRSDNIMTITKDGRSNEFEVFGGKDESSYELIQGRTLAGVLLDEVALMPKSFVDMATSRCSVEGARLWFNCNPMGPGHWFKKEWVDNAKEMNALHLHFTIEDNPGLSERVKNRYKRMYTGVFYDRYILGLWALAEGLVYQRYKDALEDTYDGDAVSMCVSCDYGTMNPFAALMWAEDKQGTYHAVKCYYYSGRDTGVQRTDDDYVRDMVEFCADMPPGEVEFIVDPSAASFITALRRYNDGKRSFRVRKAKNDVYQGIMETSTCMSTGRVKLSRELGPLMEELASYSWDTKKDDAPIKERDHAVDSLRYMVATKRLATVEGNSNYQSPFGMVLRQ